MTAKAPPMMTAKEIREAIVAFYQKPGNLAGGVLHLVQDGNVFNDALDHCRVLAGEAGDTDAIRILDALQERSLSRRKGIVP